MKISRFWSERWSARSAAAQLLLFAIIITVCDRGDADVQGIHDAKTVQMISLPPQAPPSRLLSSLTHQLQQAAAPPADKRVIAEAVSPRRLFDFVTDPSLIITILHSLEVAYWTFPFGFLLMPVINFFRVPNKRNGKDSSPRARSRRRRRHAALAGRLRHIQATLHRALLAQHTKY